MRTFSLESNFVQSPHNMRKISRLWIQWTACVAHDRPIFLNTKVAIFSWDLDGSHIIKNGPKNGAV